MAAYHGVGTTSIYEGHGCAPDVIAAYRELRERGELTMRSSLVVSPRWRSREEAEASLRDWLPHLRGQGIGDDWSRPAPLQPETVEPFVPLLDDKGVVAAQDEGIRAIGNDAEGGYLGKGEMIGCFIEVKKCRGLYALNV